MPRVLIVSAPWTAGDINPLRCVAKWLVAAGHSVSWLSLPVPLGPFEESVRNEGIDVLPTPPWPFAAPPAGRDLAKLFMDEERLGDLVRQICLAAPEHVEPVRELLRRHRIDVVVCDRQPSIVPAVIAAEVESVPYVCCCVDLHLIARVAPPAWRPSPDAGPRPEGKPPPGYAVGTMIHGLADKYDAKLAFAHNLWVSRWMTALFSTAALVGDDITVPPLLSLVGPSIVEDPRAADARRHFPWDRLRADGRIVLLSLGSLYADERLCRVVAEAAASLDVQLVASRCPPDPPGDVLAVPYAPQLALLAKARAFVTHGGLGSFNEALFHGVPMLVVPFAADQHHQAGFAEKCGAGIALERDAMTVEACRAALARILDDARHREAAQRIQASYRATDAARTVGERVVALAASRSSLS